MVLCLYIVFLDFRPPDSCGLERLAGSVWKKDVCTECTCIQGKISCFTETCTIMDICPSGIEPIQAEGHCCKVCPMHPIVEADIDVMPVSN